MKNKILILIFFGAILYVNGQQNNLAGNPNSENQSTNVVPPVPQAGEMTRYGNQPINEYKGMAQVSIPIAEVIEKDIFSKIELNYTKLGVKVDEISNNVGVSWLLNAGGVITRTINDLPDEMQLPTSRLMYNSSSQVQNLVNIQDGAPNSLLVKSYFTDESYDNEIDIFSISVNGLSGKFYLDKNLTPVLITDNHQFKIETIGNFKTTHQFVLIANDGAKYYFGGENFIEATKVRENQMYSGFTGFYLSKIQNVLGDEINFEYQNIGGKEFLISTVENRLIRVFDGGYTSCGHSESPPAIVTKSDNKLKINNAKVLSKIISKSKTIIFNYSDVANGYYNKITNIELVNNFTSKKYRQIYFEYWNQYSSINGTLDRFFLKRIANYNYKDDVEIYDNDYSFDYYDLWSLPDKKSYSVDAYGYFNNKSNSTYLPNIQLFGYNDNYYDLNDHFIYADRRSDFNFAVKGALKSITYPTKGTSFFEYEGVAQKTMVDGGLEDQVYSNSNQTVTQTESILNGNIVYDGIVKGALHIEQPSPSSMPASNGSINLKVIDISNPTVFIVDQNLEIDKPKPGEDSDVPQSREIPINFVVEKNKQYKIILKLNKANIYYSGSFSINYKSHYIQQNISGLRLKKTYDKDENNNTSNIKRLYYSSYKDINNIEILPNRPNYPRYIWYSYWASNCAGIDGFAPKANLFEIESSEPENIYIEGESFSNFTYPHITVSYGGDNFEKGGEQKEFMNGNYDEILFLRDPSSQISQSPTGGLPDFYGDFGSGSLLVSVGNKLNRIFSYDDYNGKLLENKIFAKSASGQLFVKRKIIHNYDLEIPRSIYDLRGKEVYRLIFSDNGIPSEKKLSNYMIVTLPTKSYFSTPTNTKTIEYFDDVPVNTVDDTPYKKLTTTTDYSYNNPLHYQLTSQKTTFPDLSYQITDYKYAHEKGNTYLTGKNIIGIPLETQATKTVNGFTKTISKTETFYPVDQPDANNTTSGLPLPKSVSTFDLVTGNLSTEVKYDQYDSTGNLLQYTTKSGLSTAIIWGYNNTKPIAKVEGVAYSQVIGLASAIITASDVDASTGPDNDETDFLTLMKTFKESFPNYQITTYSYDPLIGVRSITPPSGITEFYKYDSANRLEKILDNENKIVKEFKYNYSTRIYYNDQQSKIFIRNNCGAEGTGGSYTYIVPADTFSSNISKDDANAKALKDINDNGQNVANTNVSCTYSCRAIPEDSNSLQSFTSFHEISPNRFLAVVNVTFLEETRFQVSLGLIGSCAPNNTTPYTYNDGTRKWTITLNSNGSIILKGPPSYVIPAGQNVSFTFKYDK